MRLELSRGQVPELRIAVHTESTNSDLLVLAADAAVPSFTTVVTLDQTSGRGRLDREWVAPAGSALAVSVLLRDVVGSPDASWIPLAAGLAMTDALDARWPGRFGLKWPNDVLLDERKVCGILVEVSGGVDAVVGAGVNLRQTDAELPVPTAISLSGAGLTVDDDEVDSLLAAYLAGLRRLLATPIDAVALRDRITARCVTLGRRVRVQLPDAPDLEGTAVGIDPTGRLVVQPEEAPVVALAVGDVIHVRPG
jgi:BirA family biotin operon repressor/biotin-[acetyl-CoA-carboxylase] ligase